MQLHRLEGFYWVAKTGSYARAARAFPYPITQPGVYQQVKKLQDELGRALVERVAKDQMRLTPAGEELYQFCAPFFEGLPALLRRLESQPQGETLRIDAAALVLRELLPAWLGRLRRARPELAVELSELQVPDFERLRDGRVDLLIDHVADIPRFCEARVVARSYPFLVLPQGHPLARRGAALELAALRDVPLVAYHPSLRQHALQLAAVRAHIGEPRRTLSATSAEIILAFVQAGLGYSIIPWLDERGPRARGVRCLRPTAARVRFEIKAIWRKGQPLRAPIEAALALAPEPPD
ncbi:MAG: LysR family transcriptional regulator [Myxococcales bacterium]|nr:LysR family transcriptional regulator [Myxococcales bacterium]MCB9752366.1 LysR family transcriptional regulator [Myxococcales bacterium]